MRTALRAIAGIGAFGVAAFGVFLAVLFYSIEFGDSLACTDLPLGPRCAHIPDSCCMSWGPPSGAGGWAPWVLAQAVILAVIVLAAAAGWWCLPRRVAERWRWIVSRINGLIAVWLVLIGIALLLDFAVYIHFWSDWAGLPSDYQADSDATFGRAMVEGIGVAVPLVVAVVWGAVILLRRERRDQTASPAPSAEA